MWVITQRGTCAALGQGQRRFDLKGKWQRAGPRDLYWCWWPNTRPVCSLAPLCLKCSLCQTGIVSNSLLPCRSLAGVSEQIFQKEPWEYLEKHCQCYEMSHAFPASADLQEEAGWLQPSLQPPLGLVQVPRLTVGQRGHLVHPSLCSGCVPLVYGAV